jgi:sigma-E factor negative regulatory protein RseB
LLACASVAQAGADDGRDWIQRMNHALVESNYDGIFKLKISGQEDVQVMQIIHRFKDGEMVERVISMDNSGYEQKRKGSSWAEFLPKFKRAHRATRNRSYGYIPALNGLDDVTARNYRITDAGPARMIGRDVQQIHIDPRDNLRFGYRLWIDRQSALPLKFQLISHDGNVLKEIAFQNQPNQPAEISDERLMVTVEGKDKFTWVNIDLPMVDPKLKRAYSPQVALLPTGYRMPRFNAARDAARTPPRPVAAPRARFIVSDGISWCDVFITPAPAQPKADGGTMFGTRAIYSLRLDDVQVVVTGEIPMEAAKAIAEAVRPE